MELLERSFGIHTLTTEDILSPSTREKQEEYPNYLYIVLNEIEPVVGRGHFYDTQNIHILLFPNMIFSIHKKRLKFFPLVPLSSILLIIIILIYKLLFICYYHFFIISLIDRNKINNNNNNNNYNYNYIINKMK